jgi:hypothetical protein
MTEIDQFDRTLAKLDLGPILYNAVHKGNKFSNVDDARQALEWYRRFHKLCFSFPDEEFVPTEDIDEIWHHHILDTEKYYDDCYSLHGHLIQHFPYLGSRGLKDKELLIAKFSHTLRRFTELFGESPCSVAKAPLNPSVCGGGGGNCSKIAGQTRPTLD